VLSGARIYEVIEYFAAIIGMRRQDARRLA
jgi:hypothetical protein